MSEQPDPWLVRPGAPADLRKIDPAATPAAPGGKRKTEEATAAMQARLADLHDRLWAERRHSVLLVLQAMDTGGKDGTISHVLRGLNPQGVGVSAFKQPNEEELAHDFLWRVHRRTPAAGEIGVFNRSHYEDVVIVRVHSLVSEAVWRPRYATINAFENLLGREGTTVVKCFLHISKAEQARRLQARLEDPAKRWKFSMGDLAERALWDSYMDAYEEAITRTSTDVAPWRVINADQKWYRNFAVSRILVNELERLHPKYPQPDDLPDKITIE